jgi:hypothetical protein
MQGFILLEIVILWALRLHNEGTWKKFFGAMAGTYSMNYANSAVTL